MKTPMYEVHIWTRFSNRFKTLTFNSFVEMIRLYRAVKEEGTNENMWYVPETMACYRESLIQRLI